jgi:hypothetical protein
MPCLQKRWSTLNDDTLDFAQVSSPKPATSRESHRVYPELGGIAALLDVDMRWLVAVGRIKEEAV